MTAVEGYWRSKSSSAREATVRLGVATSICTWTAAAAWRVASFSHDFVRMFQRPPCSFDLAYPASASLMSLPAANRVLSRSMSLAFTGVFTFLVSVTHLPRSTDTPARAVAQDPMRKHWAGWTRRDADTSSRLLGRRLSTVRRERSGFQRPGAVLVRRCVASRSEIPCLGQLGLAHVADLSLSSCISSLWNPDVRSAWLPVGNGPRRLCNTRHAAVSLHLLPLRQEDTGQEPIRDGIEAWGHIGVETWEHGPGTSPMVEIDVFRAAAASL